MIVLHISDIKHAETIRSKLCATHRVTVRRKPSLIAELVVRGMARVVIVDIVRADGTLTWGLVQRIREASRTVPVFGYIPQAYAEQCLVALPNAVYMGLSEVITSEDDISRVIESALSSPRERALINLFQREIDAMPNTIIKKFCNHVFENPNLTVSYQEFVALLEITPSTLYSTFHRAGFGRPQQLFSRARLLAGLALLIEGDRRPESIALALGYRSGDTLRYALERETGCRARSGYSLDGFNMLAQKIRKQLNRGLR